MTESERALVLCAGGAALYCGGVVVAFALEVTPLVVLLPATFALMILAYLLYGREGIRRRRRAKGLCAACGYDLTGNVTGRCPECGAATR